MALLALTMAAPAAADFARVDDREEFISIVNGRDLTRLGINLKVGPGEIAGSAFGTPVSGEWTWRDGYFCRSLFWGEQDLGDNCQAVDLRGDTIRFTSDRGNGQSAELTLR
jgi:hypothetical protein